MASTINIYCDESCHLENDHIDVMVIGAIWAEIDAAEDAAKRIIEIKKKHGLRPTFDLKWVAVAPAKLSFFLDVVDYFFDNNALSFRGLVVPDKKLLDHTAFLQTHDDWYYKMFFVLIDQILSRRNSYRIYLDMKDTRSQKKAERLHEIICAKLRDPCREVVQRIQHVRSHEVQLLQLGDLLIGAIGYANRGLHTSEAKLAVIKRIMERSERDLTSSTLRSQKKFNLFMWNAQART